MYMHVKEKAVAAVAATTHENETNWLYQNRCTPPSKSSYIFIIYVRLGAHTHTHIQFPVCKLIPQILRTKSLFTTVFFSFSVNRWWAKLVCFMFRYQSIYLSFHLYATLHTTIWYIDMYCSGCRYAHQLYCIPIIRTCRVIM